MGGGTTVPGDRVPFVLMSVSLGEGLYRLSCVDIDRSGLTSERKKKRENRRSFSLQCTVSRGTINGGEG